MVKKVRKRDIITWSFLEVKAGARKITRDLSKADNWGNSRMMTREEAKLHVFTQDQLEAHHGGSPHHHQGRAKADRQRRIPPSTSIAHAASRSHWATAFAPAGGEPFYWI